MPNTIHYTRPFVAKSEALKCPNCEGRNLRWHIGTQGPHDVVDGRIRMSEVHAIAFLSCEECSETLRVVGEDEVNKMLNTFLSGRHQQTRGDNAQSSK